MKKQQGFTLIEMIIVVVLLALTVGLTSDILMSLVRSNTKTQVLNEIEQQANFTTLKIEKELRDARDIITPTDGESGTELIFVRKDTTQITYSIIDNVLQRQLGIDGTPYPVTSTGVGGVQVFCTSGNNCFSVSGPNPQVVRLNMEFRQGQGDVAGPSYSGSAKIESSIVIRSTY